MTNATPQDFTLNATGGSGTDIQGASLGLAGGQGTGEGAGGDIDLQVAAPASSSGSSLNNLATVESLSGTNGAALFKNSVDSTTAFQIQDAAGTTTVFDADTTNGAIGVGGASTTAGYALNVTGSINASSNIYIGGVEVCTVSACAGSSGSGNYIQNGTASQTANFNIQSASSGAVAGVIQGASGQTADLLDLEDSGGDVLDSFDKSGNLNTTGYYEQGGTIVINTTTGTNNNFFGVNVGNTTATSNNNNAVGNEALQDNTTGSGNNAMGLTALQNDTTGSSNTAIGQQALQFVTSGSNNTAVGSLALRYVTGVGNTAEGLGAGTGVLNSSDITGNALFGANAGGKLQTGGNYNTLLGYNAGYTSNTANAITTGADNTFVGYDSGPGTATQLQNAGAIGTYATVDESNALVLGCVSGTNSCTASTEVGIDNASPAYTLDVAGDINTSTQYRIGGNVVLTSTSVNGLSVSAGVINNPTISGTLQGSGTPEVTGFGTYNGQTIGSAANFTGTVAIQGADALTLGTASTNTGAIVFQGSGGAGTLTLQGPSTPDSGDYTLSLPAITGDDTICTNGTQATACSNYAPATGGNYLAKNAADTSTASVAGNLIGLTNSDNTSGDVAGVLSLTNSGTGSALSVIQTDGTEPGTGQALILANNDTSAPSGNLLDLQNKGTSELSVDVSGDLTALGNFSGTNLTLSGTAVVDTLGVEGATPICLNSANQLGTCSSNAAAVDLQQAYVASTSPQITLTSAQGGLVIQDAASAISGNLFTVQNNGGTAPYLAVSASGTTIGSSGTPTSLNVYGATSITGTLSVTSTINTDDSYEIGGTVILQTPGTGNFFGGSGAGRSTTTGSNNVGIGANPLNNLTSGSNNIALGFETLLDDSSGSWNVGVGFETLYHDTFGQNNTALGHGAGNTYNSVSTGSNNTFLGASTGFTTTTQLQNATAIGVNATVGESNALVLGCVDSVNSCTATTQVGIGTSTPAATFNVVGNDIFQAGTDSSTAFQVQNASGSDVLDIDTTNGQVKANTLGTPGTITPTLVSAPSAPTISQHGTTGSTSYSYEIVAVMTSSYASAPSTAGSTSTGNATLTGGNGNYNIVSWTAVSGASYYQIYRTAGTGYTTGLIGTTSSTSFDDTGSPAAASTPSTSGLSSSATYYYEVTALDSFGNESAPSAEVSQATSASNQIIGLSWPAVAGARSYRVYRGTSSGGENVYYTTNTNSYTDIGTTGTSATPPSSGSAYLSVLASGPTAQITIGSSSNAQGQLYVGTNAAAAATVTSVGTTGTAVYSYEVVGTTSTGGLIYPYLGGATATGNATLSSTNYNALSWNAVPNATGYSVYRIAVRSGSPTSIGLIGTTTSTSFNDTGLSASGTVPSASVGSAATTGNVTLGAVQGNYAYMTTTISGTGYLQIYDVSDAAQPTLIGSAALEASAGYAQVTVAGQYAYVLDRGAGTGYNVFAYLQVFDISNPAAPSLVSTTTFPGGNVNNLAISGGYLYAMAGYKGINAILAFDVSNPAAPSLVSYVSSNGCSNPIQVAGPYLYLPCGPNLDIYNISNPLNMKQVSNPAVDASSIYVTGRYAYTYNQDTGSIQVFDVSNPASPEVVGGAAIPGNVGTTSTDNVKVVAVGSQLYVTDTLTNLMSIYDISNPTMPSLVSVLPMQGVAAAAFDSPPIIQGRYAYALTGYSSVALLGVYDLGGEYAQQLQAGGLETGTLQVDNNAQLSGDADISGGLSVGGATELSGNLGVGGTAYFQGAASFAGGIQGGLAVSGLSAPAAPYVFSRGTTGSTSYSYEIVAIGASGGVTPASAAGTTSTGNATLSTSNWNDIQWTPVAGAVSYDVYRTASGGSPSTTGLIGTTSSSVFEDTGQAGDGTTPATYDSSGALSINSLTTAVPSAQVAISTGNANNIGMVIQGVASQSADLLELQDSTGAVLDNFDASGDLTIRAENHTTTTLEILGYGGSGHSEINSSTGWVTFRGNRGGGLNLVALSSDEEITLQDTSGGPSHGNGFPIVLQSLPSGSNPYLQITADNNATGAQPLAVLQASASQSVDLLDLEDSTGAVLDSFDKSGNLSVAGTINTASSYEIGGSVILQAPVADTFYGDSGGNTTGTGGHNIAIGQGALSNMTSGGSNIALGTTALQKLTIGQINTAVGYIALQAVTTGNNNVALGGQAGYADNADTSGSNNTFLGTSTGFTTSTQQTYATVIGAKATVGESNALVLGCVEGVNSCPANTEVGIDNASPQYALDVAGAGTINAATGYYVDGTAGLSATCSSSQTLNDVTVSGGIITGGTCTTNSSDYAEDYESSEALSPGEIVAAAGASSYRDVDESTAPGQSNLLGVVSTNPAYVIGDNGASDQYPIALAGRVPVQVNTEGGAIEPGDKITSSSVPGVGMKADSAGMVIGTALESYDGSGTGTIEVLVGTSYYDPAALQVSQGDTAAFSGLNVSGLSTLSDLTVTGNATVATLNVTGAATVGSLTVTGAATFDGDITIDGHIITAGGQPTASAQAAAGDGATVTVSGTDTTGTITITTGANGLTAGDLANILFSQNYTAAPHIVISGDNGASAASFMYPAAKSAAGFQLHMDTPPAANTTYTFDYFIAQ